jgi:hypothetical protein
MPLVPKNEIQPGVNGAPKLYGVDKNENTIPFQEKLMKLFKPQEFVTIKNIDSEPLYWQYMPSDSETENFSEDGVQRQIYREDPEMWMIEPGQTEVLVGASAYRALDTLYKNYIAKSTLRKFSDPTKPQFNENNEHLPKNFNYADGGQQDDFIQKAYLGKAMPVFGGEVAAPAAPQQPEPTPAPAADPAVPAPRTTEGAPLKAPEYAQPDDIQDRAVTKAKELTNAGKK